MRHGTILALALGLTLGTARADWYLAPDGKDAAAGTAAAPWATLEHARAAIRAERAAGRLTGPARLILRAGTYRLARTLVLEPRDSGLTIEADRGATVVVSGGRRVTGWKPWRDGILQADLSGLDLPDAAFHELTWRGRLQPWARVPNADPQHPRTGGFLRNVGVAAAGTKTVFRYRAGQLQPEKWQHPERAWMMFHDSLNYETQYCPVKRIDPAKREIEATRGVYVLSAGNPFYLCGLLEELDAPGEWCVDPTGRTLYFQPPGGDPNGADEVVVPALDQLIRLAGDAKAGALVENVRLAGLALRDCRGNAVHLTAARGCQVAACDLRSVGVGVFLGDLTRGCRVAGCDITATQGDGVSVIGTNLDHNRVSDHVIDNNYIHDIGWGRIHNRCGGVYMHRCARVKVTRNHIHDTPRYAVGMDVGNDCEIAYNYGHHSNLVTCDTSIIEAATALDWGMPSEKQWERNRASNWGNSIHHNLIHDSGGWGPGALGEYQFPRFSWGIYLDTHSSGWQIHDNVVYNTVLGGYMVNGGVDNVFANNIVVDGKEAQCMLETWPKYAMSGNRVERNIFAYRGGAARLYYLPRFDRTNGVFRANLVWAGGETPVVYPVAGAARKESWAAWLKLGQDDGAVVADPRFVDAARRDYALQADSPAYKLGFKAIDLSRVGNYADADRRTWLRPEETPPRDAADYLPGSATATQLPLRDYEEDEVGATERQAHVGEEGDRGTVRVTGETAAGGKHSLKFTDAAGLKHTFVPYVTYPLELERGTLRMAFDLRWESGALLALDWRDDPYHFNMGPNLTTDAAGWLSANGQRLLQLPAGQWVHYEIVCALGPQATGKYALTVRLPGAEPKAYPELACSPKFTTLNCVVFMSVTNGPSVFYLDNLEFRPKPAN